MTKVLVHMTPQGPVGSWRVVHGGLESYYDSSATKDDQPSAESMVNLKSNDLSWDQWFDKLTERSPYFIRFIQVDAPNNEALSDTLAGVRREYSGL
jgi:hypothetical protein